jgi:hypothetical protein
LTGVSKLGGIVSGEALEDADAVHRGCLVDDEVREPTSCFLTTINARH